MAVRIAEPHFRVGEFDRGECYIIVEPNAGDDLHMFRGAVNFRLNPGTSIDQAREIAAYLNEHISRIAEQDP